MVKLMGFILALSYFTNIVGQSSNNGMVTGSVFVENQQPADFATIALMRMSDTFLSKTTLPDKDGGFQLENIAPEKYFILISYIGYDTYRSGEINISPEMNQFKLGDIILNASTQTLSVVEVTAKVPLIERKLDRIIINVENSISSAGSHVLNLLERSPGVVVNEESGIRLRGKQGVIIMIDGKPSPLAGTDLMQYLKSVPASSIEKIELITNPSSKYDAAGNAGIINIKFKKDIRQGLNGTLSLNQGQGKYYKPSATSNLNYRNKKWNLFGNYSISAPKNFTRFFINRKFLNPDGTLESVFDQQSFIPQPLNSQNLKFGADYYLNKKTIVGVMVNGNLLNHSRNGNTASRITDPLGQLAYTTETNNHFSGKNFNAFSNINLKHNFDSTGRELTVDIDFGGYTSRALQDFTNQYYNALGLPASNDLLNTNQKGNIEVVSAKADYLQPINDKSKLETGIKSSLVTTNSDIKFFNIFNHAATLDQTRSNHFIYRENINAAYINFSQEYASFDFQVGIRMEHTHTHGNQQTTGESFTRDYAQLFPTLFFNQKLNKDHTLSFSYSRRIDRPTYRQLNPFRIFVDPYTYVVGDPSLRSVSSQVFELNHTFKNKYITNLSYTKSHATITDIFSQDDQTKISYQIPANLQDFENYNFGLSIPLQYKKFYTANMAASVYYNVYNSPLQGGQLNNDYTAFDLNFSNSFVLGKKGWSAELNSFYQSKNAWGLFIIKDLAQVTAGLAKTTHNRKSTFKLSVSDLFTTNHIAVIVQYQNMDFFTDRTWDSRVATLSWTHRFGKTTIQRARQRSTGVEEEKRRAGNG